MSLLTLYFAKCQNNWEILVKRLFDFCISNQVSHSQTLFLLLMQKHILTRNLDIYPNIIQMLCRSKQRYIN